MIIVLFIMDTVIKKILTKTPQQPVFLPGAG